jgi:hypothetical protein
MPLFSLGIGYSRYIWNNLFVSFGLDPQIETYYDDAMDHLGNGFQFWAAVMPGYRFDFRLLSMPFYLKIFFEFDYLVYKYDNSEPPEFQAIDGRTASRFIFSPYFVPDMSIGVKF